MINMRVNSKDGIVIKLPVRPACAVDQMEMSFNQHPRYGKHRRSGSSVTYNCWIFKPTHNATKPCCCTATVVHVLCEQQTYASYHGWHCCQIPGDDAERLAPMLNDCVIQAPSIPQQQKRWHCCRLTKKSFML